MIQVYVITSPCNKKLGSCHSMLKTMKKLNKLKKQKLF